MMKKKYFGLVRLLLLVILALLIISLVSEVAGIYLSQPVARIVTIAVVVVGIIWLLGKDGQKKVRKVLDDAGL